MSAYEQAQRTLDAACRTRPGEAELPLPVQAVAIAEAQVYATLAVVDELHALRGILAAVVVRYSDGRTYLRVDAGRTGT